MCSHGPALISGMVFTGVPSVLLGFLPDEASWCPPKAGEGGPCPIRSMVAGVHHTL